MHDTCFTEVLTVTEDVQPKRVVWQYANGAWTRGFAEDGKVPRRRARRPDGAAGG